MEKRGGAPSGQGWARGHAGSPLVTCCPCRRAGMARGTARCGGAAAGGDPSVGQNGDPPTKGKAGAPHGTAGRARGGHKGNQRGCPAPQNQRWVGGDPLPAPRYPNACKHPEPSPPHRSAPAPPGPWLGPAAPELRARRCPRSRGAPGVRSRGYPAVPPPRDPSRCPCSRNPLAPCPPVPGCPEPPSRRCPGGPGCGDPAGWVARGLCPARDPGRVPPPGTEPGCEKQAHHAGMDGLGGTGGLVGG